MKMRALICLFCLAGCATFPAVSGKTKYSVEFQDNTAEQNTLYKMDIKAPAGVELDSITGMTYDWLPDGSGAINVSQSGTVDSTAQAELIKEVSKQQVEAMNMMLNSLAPFLGQYMQSKDNRTAIETQSKDEQFDKIMQLLEKLTNER